LRRFAWSRFKPDGYDRPAIIRPEEHPPGTASVFNERWAQAVGRLGSDGGHDFAHLATKGLIWISAASDLW
jgi:hypothetical protein